MYHDPRSPLLEEKTVSSEVLYGNDRLLCCLNPTLLRYALAITEQNKCRESLAQKLDRFQTLRNDMLYGMQHLPSNNVGCRWPTILRPFARGFKNTVSTRKFNASLPEFSEGINLPL